MLTNDQLTSAGQHECLLSISGPKKPWTDGHIVRRGVANFASAPLEWLSRTALGRLQHI
jgi:hypothetical protein